MGADAPEVSLSIAVPLCIKNFYKFSNFYKVKHLCLNILSLRF